MLHGRVNRAHARTISLNNIRNATRGSFTEVVWVLPCQSSTRFNGSEVFPAVTKDISSQGLSIFHTAPLVEKCVLIGLHDETGRRFLACSPKHCTSLGYGFYQIGLMAEEVAAVSDAEYKRMCDAMSKYEGVCDLPQPGTELARC